MVSCVDMQYRNDCSVIKRLFYGLGKIKAYHRAQNFITELLTETRANQNAASSTKLYRRTIPRRWTNYVPQRKTYQITLVNKNTKSISNIQLQRKCQVILTYSNVVGIFQTDLTLRMNERAWPLQKTNNIRRCWKLQPITIIATVHHCSMRSFNKQLVK